MDVRHLADADQALAEVGEPLRFAGAEGELSFGILRRLIGEPDAYGDEVTILIGMRSGGPAALVTMTGPHPALIVGFADVGDVGFSDLVGAMVETGRRPLGVNGARRWSEPFVQAWHDRAGAASEVYRDMHAFELRTVRPPRLPAGRFRAATPDEAGGLARWFVAFGDIRELITLEDAARRAAVLISGGDLAVWELDGEAVSMAAVSRRTPWSSSIGFVYTPPELRGRGYASAVTAALSQRELAAGQGWCSLFTDQANATSNHIYADIGYEPKSEFRHFTLTW